MGIYKSLTFLVGLSSVFTSAQECQINTVTDTVPTNNEEVVLQSYSYCGGSLNATVFIANLNYDKIVTLFYTDRRNVSTPLTSLSLGYRSSISDTNYEYWGSNAPIYLDGVSELLNLTYQAINIGQTFVQPLNIQVEASGAPEPTQPGPPAPYASPSGLADDITEWLRLDIESQATLSKRNMFSNINPSLPGVANGTVVAAKSGPSYTQKLPDYEYNWVRDASLTFDTVNTLYIAASNDQKSVYEEILFQYAKARANEQNAPGLQTGLGEPKFYLNNTIFTGPWGRPQNDGPATAAITLMEFANEYLENGGDIETVKSQIYDSTVNPNAPVQKDLLFVASNWTTLDFDLWEEVVSAHFYTRMVQRKALLQGADFATKMGDSATSEVLAAAGTALTATLAQFWNPNRQLILYEYGPILRDKASYKDIAVALGVIHGYIGDDVFSFTNDQILSSLLQISTSFIPIYGIANTTIDASGLTLGIPIGRYPEDVYNGTGTEDNGGNPWYLATATMAEMLYRGVSEYRSAGSITVTNTSLPFFTYFASATPVNVGSTYGANSTEFDGLIEAMLGWGDAFLRRIKYHTPETGSLSEQYNRNTGVSQGAADLTWSYAALLEAAIARADVSGDEDYTTTLANLPLSEAPQPY
ncbi:glucoamylase-like protein [Elsinoe australis]|uniref:glucan 1,4-alpha-glucosidase n=1 Tax=Elsinoe australis TaxID=40998 RepID=A0A4U7AYJ5_9PEZI|nr:glucoamylase-like protein [Elsinoe australis]